MDNNLSMAWMDSKKVFDFVPHSSINECMELIQIAVKCETFWKRVWSNGSHY